MSVQLEGSVHWRWIEHAGMRILELDLRGCNGDEAARRHIDCSRMIASLPERSVLMLTLARGVRYDPWHIRTMAGQLRENAPFIVASAVVGLEHLTKLLNVLNRLSGRNLRAFDDVDHAIDWLVRQARDIENSA